MSEDVSLLNDLEKLELETNKISIKKLTDNNSILTNPFMRRRRSKSLSSINFGSTKTTTKKCECWTKNYKTIRHTTNFKRTNNKKILREPILKIIKCSGNHNQNESSAVDSINSHKNSRRKEKLFGECSKDKECDFKSIIRGCKLLNLKCSALDNESDSNQYQSENFLNLRPDVTNNNLQFNQQRSDTMGSSCSHQARLNSAPPCDVTIDELASYFETFVHIPKKMSSMAEMMYI